MDSSSVHPFNSTPFAITDEEFNLFHFIDRKLFTRLIDNLARDPNESVHVMGFWLWLEQDHIKDLTIIHKLLHLSFHILNQVVEETVFCMKLIENDTIQPENLGCEFHLLQKLAGKLISLQQLHANRLTVLRGVSRVINEVCVRAFRDIIEKFAKNPEGKPFDPREQGVLVAPAPTWTLGEPLGHGDVVAPAPMRVMVEPSGWQGVVVAPGALGPMQGGGPLEAENIPMRPILVGSHEIRPPFYPGATPFHPGMPFQGPTYPVQIGGNMPGFAEGQMRFMGNEMYGNNQRYGEEDDDEVDADKRTIFLTFSKGYPISEDEVREYFTRRFGDFIETIHMQEVQGDGQVLYARVIAKSVAMMDRVVEGGRAKYYINGKHVCARKYVRMQRSPQRAGSV